MFYLQANVPYDEVFLRLEDINNDFPNCDVAYVIGANDVTNPVAKTKVKTLFMECQFLMLKNLNQFYLLRSLSPGYVEVDNDLFYRENTLMLFSDAKKITEEITKSL